EGVDLPIAEVADKQVAAKAAEAGRGDGQPPGRIELTASDDATEEVTRRCEHVDEAKALAGDVVLRVSVLLGVGDEERAIDVLDPEWPEARGDPRVDEGAGWRYQVEVAVEHVHPGVVEVRRVEEVAGSRRGDGEALVDGVHT